MSVQLQQKSHTRHIKYTRADVRRLTFTGYHVRLFLLRLLSQGQCTSAYRYIGGFAPVSCMQCAADARV